MPPGAILDAAQGILSWTPNPGQVGDYAVTYAVTDGEKIVTQTSLVRVAVAPTIPTVSFDLTPSFPAVPGQKVIVQTLANGLAAITNIIATVDGRPVTVDSQGRIEITPTTPGRLVVDVTATDADGRVGHNSTVVKVRDLQDSTAPVVTFAPGLDGAKLTSITNIIGSINDSNLDSWVLSVADFGENVYRTLASGNGAVSDRTLAQFDPGILENGFYQLRLQATDISDRSSETQVIVEVNTTTKASAYLRTETDLSVNLGGNTINLVRTYSSLNTDEVGSFGNGWQLASLDTNIQTNVPLTGRESLGVYEPFRVGTRLYLTTPTGERVGFTFAPQKHTIPGLTYYTPSWVADSGVNYTLSSASAKLTLAGNRFYDLKTGHAYNPGSGEFDGADYTLSSVEGTVYHLSSAGGVTEQIGINGTRLIYSDSGITSSTGETVRFVKDDLGRLTQITAPDGSLVVYSYDALGNLVSARNLASGQASRYGYSSNLLTLATGTPGTAGEAIAYSTTPQVSPVLADLGSAAQFTGKTINDSVGESDRYTFSLRDSELRSTATGTVLLGVELQGNMALPTLLGLTPVATHLDASGSYALFAVNRAGLNLISLSPSPHLPTSLSLLVAGDVNRDGNVDGVDSGLLEGAIASGVYNTTYDFNRDGVINAADVQILGSNYGFTANRAPVVTSTSVLTHSDLSTSVALDKLATDAEGDAIFYRIINPVNGAVTFTPDGHSAFFLPTAGYSGMASFDVVADDGFSSSAPAKVTVNVSNAALVNLDFARRGLRLDVGGSTELVVVGDFADQQDVILPYDYLQLASDNAAVAVMSAGKVTGFSDGVSVLSAGHGNIQAVTALRVGLLASPTNQKELNVAIAQSYGLKLYPQAVTLTEGVQRQLLVGLNGVTESPDLKTATSGTRYFVSNSNILQVSENGLITTLEEGIANVTVIYGGAEKVIPVQVETAHIGSTVLGTNGGAVKSSFDGSTVMIAPGALKENTTVSIQQLRQDELTLPMPENFSFAGAFKLDIGNNSLALPAQLAIPAPADLTPGTEVFFLRQGELPDADGNWKSIWFVEESGVVTADGMIRTSSPPWPGVAQGGTYTIAVPKFSYSVGKAIISPEQLNNAESRFIAGTALVIIGLGIAVYAPAALLGLGIASYGTDLLLRNFVIPFLAESNTEVNSSVDIVTIPKVGRLPYITTAQVELNPRGIPTTQVNLNTLPPGNTDPFAPPVLQAAELDFNNGEPIVYVTGSNFLNDSGDLGSHFEDLKVNFHSANQTFQGIILPELSTNLGNNLYKLAVKPPVTVVLGESYIEVVRQQKEQTGSNSFDTKIVTYDSKRDINLTPKSVDLSLVAQVFSDTVTVINAANPQEILATPDLTSRDLVLARIPVGTVDKQDGPRDIAVTGNGTRAYVTLENSGRIAVIDLMMLRQVDTNPETAEIDPIVLPDGARPREIVISPDDKFAYITDWNIGTIYVLDINPYSTTYNKLVQTINLGSTGLRQLAINQDGDQLFVTTPSSSTPGKGQIFVINIDPKDRPIGLAPNTRKWHQQIGVIEADAVTEGIAATPDPMKMVFTNRGNDAKGFGLLTITNDDPLHFAATTTYTQVGLGSAQDYFDVNEAMSVVVTDDGKYAFVTGRNGRLFGSGIPSIDAPNSGSNIGIIKDPLTDHAKLVAATRPIPMGLTTDIVLSGNDKYLYASYPGVASVFGFDVDEIIKTVENSAYSNSLQTTPIDDINPNISIAADLKPLENSGFGVPDGSNRAPLGLGSNPYGMAGAFTEDWLNLKEVQQYKLLPIDVITDPVTIPIDVTPPGQIITVPNPDLITLPDLAPVLGPGIDLVQLLPVLAWEIIKRTDVFEVNLTISTFPIEQGLFPGEDEFVDQTTPLSQEKLSINRNGVNDYNPNRVVTATWTVIDNQINLGQWKVLGKTIEGTYPNDKFPFLDQLNLTSGQKYYWGIEAKSKTNRGNPPKEVGEFYVPLPKPITSTLTNSVGLSPPVL